MNHDDQSVDYPSPARTCSHNRQVSFNPSVTQTDILSLYDYTPAEISAAWFNEDEMEDITKRCFKVLKKIEAGKGRKYCTRGLEGHTTIGSISKRKTRTSAAQAVLQEQALLWQENKIDDQVISDAYYRTTSSCQLWAQVVGKRDQEVAEAIFDEDETVHETLALIGSLGSSMPANRQSTTKPILSQKRRSSIHKILQRQGARAA